jgi:hypothetical protein
MATFNEYRDVTGGVFYYTQNRPGTKWFDSVNNSNGWTVDFSLRVADVVNSDEVIDENSTGGLGIYVNDGSKKEVVNFLTQEIIFRNANRKITFDATRDANYRLTGKDEELKLYSQTSDEDVYNLIADVDFLTESTNEGNGLKPSVFEDTNGDMHAVWHDDGGTVPSVYYSKFSNSVWSVPEKIGDNFNGSVYPNILVGPDGIVYVTYEKMLAGYTSISFIYKDDNGWSDEFYIGIDGGDAKYPKMVFDSTYNVCVVWEDYRTKQPSIYYNKFLKETLTWEAERRIDDSDEYGSLHPSISSYFDNIFITWTTKYVVNNQEFFIINIADYDSLDNTKTIQQISATDGWADYSDVNVNVGGRVCVVWQDNKTGEFEIYATVLSPDLNYVLDVTNVSDGYGGAKYPVLSEKQSTGDMYIVWQDYKSDYKEFNPIGDPSDIDEYRPALEHGLPPVETSLYVAVYDALSNAFLSKGTGSFNTTFTFLDDRSVSYPSVPSIFSGEIPIVYESSLIKLNNSLTTPEFFIQIRQLYYDTIRSNLSATNNSFIVDHGISEINPSDRTSPSVEEGIDRDLIVSGQESRKEIRFGDFSNTLTGHLVFRDFKYYTKGAIVPFVANELLAKDLSITSLSAKDASVNNYGDVWLVGYQGVMYYSGKNKKLYVVGDTNRIDDTFPDGLSLTDFKVIAFDKNNYMFIGGEEGLYYSVEHFHGFSKIDTGLSETEIVLAIGFDKSDNLFIGTNNGLYKYKINYANTGSGVESLTAESLSGGPSGEVTSIKMDSNGVMWIGTHNGLYRYYNNSFLRFDVKRGMPSNWVNDVAIRNTAIRYIATDSGIAKMVGSVFEDVILSENDNLYNDNAKCVLWKEPNFLWAGTLSKINQIMVDDLEGTYSTLIYHVGDPLSQNELNNRDLQMYYVSPLPNNTIEDNDIIEVLINGTKVSFGYTLGYDSKVEQRVIMFDSVLKSDDIIEVVVRKDLKLIASFIQTEDEKKVVPNNRIEIKNITTKDEQVYLITEGDKDEVMVNDIYSNLPFDRVHLDTTAPTFTDEYGSGMKIVEQVDKSVVSVEINGTTDGEYGSGVSQMIVSNYENFTIDGTNPQSPVDFSNSFLHNLGLSFESALLEFSFINEDGIGSKIEYFVATQELYAATSQPGSLYKYGANGWQLLYSYGGSEYVDFIAQYNNKVIVSVGHPISVAKLYVYDYDTSSDTGLTLSSKILFSESRAFCYYELNNKMYIGTGPGYGSEYQAGVGDSGGVLYTFDGSVLSSIISELDDNIYGLTSSSNSDSLIAVTGQAGFVYELDLTSNTSIVVHTASDSISSVTSIDHTGNELIFIGDSGSGTIKKSLATSVSYNTSFELSATGVAALKVFKDSTDLPILYAAIGNMVYYLSEGGSWVWRYTHNEEINDITASDGINNLYVISNTSITKIQKDVLAKSIYLKLIDRAGNETLPSTLETPPEPDNKFIDSISIQDLVDFVNENKIFEIDASGNVEFTLRGDGPFYSGDKIEEEKGVYESVIFDGTQDLVKWDMLLWNALELYGTSVTVYVRTSDSENDILIEDWIGPYTNDQASGVDISYLSGQFLQFKLELKSTLPGTSPTFYNMTIRAVTTEAMHFFTTNFILPSRVRKGILTGRTMLPVSADIIFGINTTNSVEWTDYQLIDENRIFNVDTTGKNLRVGIKFITPNRSSFGTSMFGEYGPYNSSLYSNVIDFTFTNSSSENRRYHFKVNLYEADDFLLTTPVYTAFSYDSGDGFSVDGSEIEKDGFLIDSGDSSDVLFSPAGSQNIGCGKYYFVKVESAYDLTDATAVLPSSFTTDISFASFIQGCNTSFVDNINFNFTNESSQTNDYNFRIQFYNDPERISDYLTVYSGNDVSGWLVDNVQIPTGGISIGSGGSVAVIYRVDESDLESNKIYYLTIEAHDGTQYVPISESYTFRVNDNDSSIYCGEYEDVPIVKNFAIMVELQDNEFITLNV